MKTAAIKLFFNHAVKDPGIRVHAFLRAMTAAAACALILACAPACEAGITSYRESVVLDNGGGAKVSIEVQMPTPALADTLIPCSLPGPRNAFVSDGSNEVTAAIEDRGGSKFIRLGTAAFEKSGTARARYESEAVFDTAEAAVKDFGNIEVKYSFVNGTGEKIDSFEAAITLPPAMVVNAVSEYLPKPKKDEVRDPYSLSKKDGRRVITISCDAMKFGDRAALRFSMKNEKRSYGVLLIFLAVAIWYLASFRELIFPHGERRDHEKKSGTCDNIKKTE